MDFADSDKLQEKADELRAAEATARRAAEIVDDEKKQVGGGIGNPADADLGANIRPDVASAPGGLVTVTTAKSATYHPEQPDAENDTHERPQGAHAFDYNLVRGGDVERYLLERSPDNPLAAVDTWRAHTFYHEMDVRGNEQGAAYSWPEVYERLGREHPEAGRSADHDAAIGADIRLGRGFTQWPDIQETAGDLIADICERDPYEARDVFGQRLPALLAGVEVRESEASAQHQSAEHTDGASISAQNADTGEPSREQTKAEYLESQRAEDAHRRGDFTELASAQADVTTTRERGGGISQ